MRERPCVPKQRGARCAVGGKEARGRRRPRNHPAAAGMGAHLRNATNPQLDIGKQLAQDIFDRTLGDW